MDPISLAVLAFGAGFKAFGEYKSGKAQQRIGEINARSIEYISDLNARLTVEGANDNADVLEFNARMYEAQARDAIVRGAEEETKFRQQLQGLIGSQRAGYAGGNVDVSSGSALAVQLDTAYQGELDALTIRTNAYREAWGFTAKATNEQLLASALRRNAQRQALSIRAGGKAQATSSRLQGNAAASAGAFGAVGTILGATSTVLNAQYGFGRAS